jgi:hypothetical protein
MRDMEIRISKPEIRMKRAARRSADILVGFAAGVTQWSARVAGLVTTVFVRTRMSALQAVAFGSGPAIRFQKYRVAARLGTNTVRQRLLLGLHAGAALTATETGMA